MPTTSLVVEAPLSKLQELRRLQAEVAQRTAQVADVAWSKARRRWLELARPEQVTPDGEWFLWFVMAGRGFGKTRTGAEDIAEHLRLVPDARVALICQKFGDGRDVMVEGESGLLSVLPPSALRGGSVDRGWNRSLGELICSNGARAKLYSSETPDKLRGPQHTRLWGDEPASWENPVDTWDMAMLGLRLGADPRAVLTGTPKPTKLIRQLIARADCHLTRGRTYDNLANLAPSFAASILSRYEGTRLGRQELDAEILTDVEGALWTLDLIDGGRVHQHSDMVRVVVAVDPAGGSTEDNDETGIVVAGKAVDGQGYVLSDRSCRESPHGWAGRAIAAYHEFKADRIVAEKNYGGEMVLATIKAVDPHVPVTLVSASRGKQQRAEPIAAYYEQGRVHHVGTFVELEDQMCTFVPGMGESPDRMDALVWALTDLLPTSGMGEFMASISVTCGSCGGQSHRTKTSCMHCGAALAAVDAHVLAR